MTGTYLTFLIADYGSSYAWESYVIRAWSTQDVA